MYNVTLFTLAVLVRHHSQLSDLVMSSFFVLLLLFVGDGVIMAARYAGRRPFCFTAVV